MNNEVYIKGDRGEYVGTSELIHGGLFYHVNMTEGRFAGQVKVTQVSPSGYNPHAEFRRNQFASVQADFSKLLN